MSDQEHKGAARTGVSRSLTAVELAGRLGTPSAPIVIDVHDPEEFGDGRSPARGTSRRRR